jgi:D-3-phosphoglycerate dehydrogenase
MSFMGRSLDRATVGLVGFGNIGREVARLLLPFGARIVVSDPHIEDAAPVLHEYSAQALSLDELLTTSDFVILLCPLSESTFHLIDERRLRMMKSQGYLINLSRGQVVNQSDLTSALKQGWIAGAAIDVFEREPVDDTEELLQLENVIATPHSICWTDGMAAGCGNSAIDAILAFASGHEPRYIVNDSVLQHPRYQRMRALRAATFYGECQRPE